MVPVKRILGFVACANFLWHAPAAGQQSGVAMGAVTEDVVSSSDPSQRYALYVPTAYSPDTVWPVVLIMDPRGQALLPLLRLREPAERLGYVLISSYNTASDGPAEPNEIAVEAMITDVQQLLSVDERRLYFVGFSGTARAAWLFGTQLAQHTAGIIGFGAGLPAPAYLLTLTLADEPPFAFYGGAGELDFNYEEVLELDWALDSRALAHFVEVYSGPHAWPPAEVFAHALEWMDVQAVRAELRDRDQELLDALHQKRFDRAQRLEAEGAVHAAAVRYQAIVTDFDDLVDVDLSRTRARELARSLAFRDTDAALRAAVEERRQFAIGFGEFLVSVRETNRPPTVEAATRTLEIAKLQARAARTDDPEDARTAQRILERVFVQASFYQPRYYMEQGEFEIAVAMFELADAIKPGSPRVCFGLAGALAQIGQYDRAFEALECAAASGALAGGQLESDSLLAPLRADARFGDLVRRIR
jgi:tetratricopeptide (TPR) repeat protein